LSGGGYGRKQQQEQDKTYTGDQVENLVSFHNLPLWKAVSYQLLAVSLIFFVPSLLCDCLQIRRRFYVILRELATVAFFGITARHLPRLRHLQRWAILRRVSSPIFCPDGVV
jgi:hypothetical protein